MVRRQLQAARTQHQKDSHPYRPFPIALLEETVANVPTSSYPEQEKCLLDFGVSQLYRYAPAHDSCALAQDAHALNPS